jgi:F-type H+-transporting ATPase subunit b
MLQTAEFWVFVSFVIFMGILGYVGVHKTILSALDARSKKISSDLDEARTLREEAQKVLADYERKRREAEGEAKEIISAAKAEAERLAQEAKQKSEDFVARRTKMAETKIAQAEAQAIAEVRAVAANAAVKAAGEVLKKTATGKKGEELVQKGLKEVRSKLH